MRHLISVLLYLAVTLAPLGIVLIPPVPEGRGFWIELAVALGFIGFQQIVVQFVLVGRFQLLTRASGIDVVLGYHRWLGVAAITVLALHPLCLLVAGRVPPALLGQINLSGIGSLLALLLLALFSFRRVLFHFSYEAWRLLHAALGSAAMTLGVFHLYWVGVYVNSAGKLAFFLFCALTGTAFLLYLRLVRPVLQWRKPYRVVDVSPQRGSTWLLTLEPQGHPGLRFEAGQFAWLKISETPFILDEHPLSFSSSAEDTARIEFAVKEQGDWSGRIGSTRVGAIAYLDGPHGAISTERQQGDAYTLIAGGIGIAPMMSILRTFKDLGDRRPLQLIYGNRNRARTPFFEELTDLEAVLDLEVVHVLHDPEKDWVGQTGFIEEDLLRQVIAEPQQEGRIYFICGPNPMVEMVARGLLSLGVDERRIFAERFALV